MNKSTGKIPPITMSKLYIGNLPQDTNETTIRELFAEQSLSCTNVLVKRGGYAFVDCPDQSSADKAIDKLNGFSFQGSSLVVEPSVASGKKRDSNTALPDSPVLVGQVGNGWIMFPETFEFILGLIGPGICTTKSVKGRKPIDAKKQLLLTLWVMATPDSYRSICEKFNVGKATAIRSVRRVSYALYCLAPRFIQWPAGERIEQVMSEFERYSAFPQVIGAIDGTHIKIKAPREDAESYINRKGCHSIQVQAVCTYNLLFTSVFAGNAGCVHDARVFRLSPVQQYINNPDIFFPNDSHIIGDAAYGIHPNVMVPFKDNGHLTARQKNFNFCLSSARMSIERTFGLWKGRWRSILDCLPMVALEKIPEYLLATCVLHNICILQGDMFPVEQMLRINRRRGRLILNQRIEGGAKRNRIMNNLIMRNN